MRTQGEDGRLHATERGLRRKRPCPHLDLRLPGSRAVSTYISVFKPPSLWDLVLAPRTVNTAVGVGRAEI